MTSWIAPVVRREKQTEKFGPKLDEAKARAILAAKGKQDDIAAQFQVSQQLVSKIKRRVMWKHL